MSEGPPSENDVSRLEVDPSDVHIREQYEEHTAGGEEVGEELDGGNEVDENYNVDNEVNPFSLPKDDVFLLREREKKAKREERDRQKGLKVWEKNHGKKSNGIVRSSRLNRGNQKFAAPKQDRMFQGRRREKENMADFIAKKRDMFLIQMSLDTKRQEIQKLEEKAQMKEDALRKSEMMLEEDAMRFDAFLKENDRKAHDALKRADQETKEKQEKVIEIKKLNQDISKVDNEMSKYEEQLNACLKYKKFLDELTPKEHYEAMLKKKEARRQEKFEQAKAQNPHLTLEEVSDDEEDMYFKKPEQLLEIFAQLEERNLFLIQNVQETEEALEELKQKYEETERQMNAKTTKLKENIDLLKEKIKSETEKAEQLKKRTKGKEKAGNQQKLLQGLSDKVKEVYTKCGFDADTQTDTLDMLREIEGSLENLLNQISKQDDVKVAEAEKKKETERRNRVRKLKKEEQKRQYEERLAKSTARAKAEVVKQTGKQIMFRSAPIRKKKKKEEDKSKKDDEAEDVKKFFT